MSKIDAQNEHDKALATEASASLMSSLLSLPHKESALYGNNEEDESSYGFRAVKYSSPCMGHLRDLSSQRNDFSSATSCRALRVSVVKAARSAPPSTFFSIQTENMGFSIKSSTSEGVRCIGTFISLQTYECSLVCSTFCFALLFPARIQDT